MVDCDGGTGAFSLMLEILHVCGHAHVRSHVYPGMDCVDVIFEDVNAALGKEANAIEGTCIL